MSFQNIIQDVKEEIGSISRKGFDVKLGYSLRLGSHQVASDGLRRLPIEAPKQCCWSNLPSELLRDILMRIEAAEWPRRKDVVACAGVCRSWRETMKELVKTPEVSGKLTFPISVKQPGPRDLPLQCFIRRSPDAQAFFLYFSLTEALTDHGKFLLAARKCRRATCTDYLISVDAEGSGTYIGKLRSNFLGRKFTIYDSQPHAESIVSKSRSTTLLGFKQAFPRISAGNYPVAHIAYGLNVLGSRCPRRMHCVMDSIPISALEPGGVAPTQTDFPWKSLDSLSSIPIFRFRSSRMDNFSKSTNPHPEVKLILNNKAPRWHEQLQCWCLNFHGRVTVASVKNFQLVAEDNGPGRQDHNDVILQFGKVGKDLFTMDYRYPISAFQAFSICLSSFDTKLACE